MKDMDFKIFKNDKIFDTDNSICEKINIIRRVNKFIFFDKNKKKIKEKKDVNHIY